MLGPMLLAAWDGLRLRCPACRRGRMADGAMGLRTRCPHCGAEFEPEEGDFLGAMVVAYAVTALLVVVGVYLVAVLTDLSARDQLILWSVAGTLFLILTYRNMKGAWVGILYAMTGLRKQGR
ncbi:MAG: DUF983 domain-containing protein [Bacillota bacterium]